MHKYMVEVKDYIQYKIIFGLVASVFTDDFFKLLCIFALLEFMDIFTRWLSLSRQCFLAIYQNVPCSLWRAFTFMWQARKWRFIKSAGLRDGFCDKMLIYLTLLLLAALVDGALYIAHSPRVLLTITVTVLAATEAISILENLSETGVGVVAKIKDRFLKKVI